MKIHTSIRTLAKTGFDKAHPVVLTLDPDAYKTQQLGMTYDEACALRDSLSRTIAVYTDARRAELAAAK